MSPILRVAAFAAALALVFGVAALAGAELDPSVDEAEPEHAKGMADEMSGHSAGTAPDASLPGLAIAAGGYRLEPERSSAPARAGATYRFRIAGPGGETVREFDVEHERRMHLILVRRDFTGFQHLHPRLTKDGSWEAKADLSEPGVYRVFADFATDDTSLTLGTDLFVAGRFEPQPFPRVDATDRAGDGYAVSLRSEAPTAGGTTPVEFTVRRHGRELQSVEPYLGADGHLVALREHDQAFLHTHPQGEPGGAGPISFAIEYPSPGRYRLFLQFKHAGEVRTAAFTQVVHEASAAPHADDELPGAEEDAHGG